MSTRPKEKTFVWRRDDIPDSLSRALTSLGEEFHLRPDGAGCLLRFESIDRPGRFSVRRDGEQFVIQHGSTGAALRGVAQALAGCETEGDTSFEKLGIMLDCSRGAVMTVDYLKKWARRLALLGYNLIMLYTEDTYQLPGEPYFGYMRGGYSMNEAHSLGRGRLHR